MTAFYSIAVRGVQVICTAGIYQTHTYVRKKTTTCSCGRVKSAGGDSGLPSSRLQKILHVIGSSTWLLPVELGIFLVYYRNFEIVVINWHRENCNRIKKRYTDIHSSISWYTYWRLFGLPKLSNYHFWTSMVAPHAVHFGSFVEDKLQHLHRI